MKKPKAVKRYCPYCKKHTEHRVKMSKKKAASSLTKGSKVRMKKRSKSTGKGNKGKLSKGALSKWKRYGKKPTKKTDFRYECKVCKKTHMQKRGIRAKRVEFV